MLRKKGLFSLFLSLSLVLLFALPTIASANQAPNNIYAPRYVEITRYISFKKDNEPTPSLKYYHVEYHFPAGKFHGWLDRENSWSSVIIGDDGQQKVVYKGYIYSIVERPNL